MVTVNSGREVPIAIIVNPMNVDDISKKAAILIAETTKKCFIYRIVKMVMVKKIPGFTY